MARPGDDEATPPGARLTRWRAAIARARERAVREGARGFVDELISQPDAAQLVPTLPVQELYYAIREVGLADSHDLVALASPEQVQGFLDLDAWRREELLPERISEWIDALVDAGPERLLAAIAGLDDEVPALYLQRHLRVYDLTLEEPPEEPEGHFYPTPDRFYLLDVLDSGEEGKRVERFLDWLYRADLDFARKTVMGAKWGLSSELEEYAYRWRAGRMADLGFVDFYDALKVYRWLDPATVHVGEGSADASAQDQPSVPAAIAASLGAGGFLARALEVIDEPGERARIQRALLVLANRVMAADLVEPGDIEAARGALERMAAYLGVGLEYLGRGDAKLGAEALRTIAASRIFRVGVSLTIKLKQAAETLAEKGWVTLVPRQTSLLDPPWSDAVAALRRHRPLFGLVSPARPFATLAEVAQVAALLEEAALMGQTVQRGLGVDPERLAPAALEGVHPPRPAITFNAIVGTLLCNALLDRPPALVPLRRADLAPLRARVIDAGALRPVARERMAAIIEERLAERGVDRPAALPRWLQSWSDHLERTLAPSVVGAPASDATTTPGLLVRG